MSDSMRGKSKQQFLDQYNPSPEMVSLREQLRAAQARIDSLEADIGTDQRLVESVRASIPALPKYEKLPMPKSASNRNEAHPLLVLADPHSEERVRKIETEGLAEYNWEIFESRSAQVGNKTIELTQAMRQISPIRNLTVACLGDCFLGEIHPEDTAYGQTMPLPMALPGAARTIANVLMMLGPQFEKIRFIGMCGNHSRNTKKPVTKMTAERNWDMALYMIVREFCRAQENIQFELPLSIMSVHDIMGWKCLFTHGDCIQKTHRSPYYGIEDTFDREHKARRGTGQDFDYVYMGHLHHRAVLDNNLFVCPSMIGPSQYTQYRVHKNAMPAQLLTFYTEKHGPSSEWLIALR